MPVIFGASITALANDINARTVTVTGEHFGENVYGVSAVYLSSDNSTWTRHASITSWSESTVVAVFGSLDSGTFYVKIVTSDDETATWSGEMVFGSRLSKIAYDIKKAIQEITVANGYAVTWGSVNQPDMALQTSPSAEITYVSEEAADALGLGHHGFTTVEFVIRIRCKLATTQAIPNHTIDALQDTALFAMRKRMRALCSTSTGVIVGSEAPIMYKRMERQIEKAGDRFIPGDMLTYWEVKYFDRD